MTEWDDLKRQVLSGELTPSEALRTMFGYPQPTRNDCGYPGRYDHEDASRMHGWGVEGEGPCDYPDGCPWLEDGRCPFYTVERGRLERRGG